MKNLSLAAILLAIMSCSSEQIDWDSGAAARNSFEETDRQEEVETMRDQIPPISEPHTEKAQPF